LSIYLFIYLSNDLSIYLFIYFFIKFFIFILLLLFLLLEFPGGSTNSLYFNFSFLQVSWVPRNIYECSELYKQRIHERTVKVWGEGYIHISPNTLVSFLFSFFFFFFFFCLVKTLSNLKLRILQHWKRRFAKLHGGKMYTFEEEVVLSFLLFYFSFLFFSFYF